MPRALLPLLLALLLPCLISCRGQQEAVEGGFPVEGGSPVSSLSDIQELRSEAAGKQPRSGRGLEYSADTLLFNGQPLHLWAGELPYYRVDPAVWAERLDAAKQAGLRFISAYIPWNLHEQSQGHFDFTGSGGEGRRNLVRFLQLIAERDMYFIAKPGPFICAEVRHGGIPDWLTDQHPEIIMRDQHGWKVRFRLDGTPLPDHLNPTYVDYVRRWYTALYQQVLSQNQFSRGPIVAVQIDNELIYSTSRLANPFSWGYTPAVEQLYRRWLEDTYGYLPEYNRSHGSRYGDYVEISPPKAKDWHIRKASDWLSFQDWVHFKSWYGTAVLRKYAGILEELGVSVPLYHNAGMLEDEAPMVFGSLSSQLWLGVNFWLVPHPLYSASSYVRGVRRLKQLRGSQPDRPSITPEVNWGWGNSREFDFLTRYTLPYSKATDVYPLVDSSSAGTLNGRPYSTNREPYPGDAPIDDRGGLRPAYRQLLRLIRYTESEGQTFARAEPVSSISLASYAPYNTPALYTSYGHRRSSELENVFTTAIGSNEFLQELMSGLIEADAEFDSVDLQRGALSKDAGRKMLIVLSQEMMGKTAQAALVDFVEEGGILVLMPTLPSVGLLLQPLPLLKEALLPELTVKETHKLPSSREFVIEGNGVRYSGSRVAHYLQPTSTTCRILATDGAGKIAAVEKPVGRGKVFYIGTYCTDPDLYMWLAQREGIPPRYAYSNNPEFEVVPITDLQAEAIYLFLLNRGERTVSAEVHYQDPFAGSRWHTISTSTGGRSVSILKVRAGALLSASLYGGGRGIVARSEETTLILDRANAADVLREMNGDILFWANRSTRVYLEGQPGKAGSHAARVLTGGGEVVPAVRTQNSVCFTYHPSSGVPEYYRLLTGDEP